jgi:putative CocE/NonD family hydrolase
MRRLVGVVCLAAALAAPASAHAWKPERARFGVSAAREFPVRMSDGVDLRADVYWPTDPATGAPARGRFPVVLSQTPYGKRSAVTTSSGNTPEGGGNGHFPYLVRRGYINVVADVRGTGSSDGDFGLFGPREVRDGVELVRWAARLPHSNGRVGGAGESYVGLNQLFTAATIGRRSPLKAIFPVTAGNDLYRDLVFAGGIPNLEFASFWTALRASMTGSLPDDPTADPLDLAAHPIGRGGNFAANDAGLYAEIDTGGDRGYDVGYWRQRAPSAYLPRIVANGIPAFLVSGWFDVYQRGVVRNYAELQNAFAHRRDVMAPMTPRQRATGRYQLAVGPWFHDPTGLGTRYQELMLEWFDTWLKRKPTGMARTRTPLHAFELGPNRWVRQARFPLPAARVRSLYLGEGGTLGKAPSGATTDKLPWTGATSPCNRNIDQWNTGLGTYGFTLAGFPGMPICTGDDRTTQAASVTYTTAPFKSDRTVAGPITARVYLSSTTPDAELVATVEDVGPDGSSYPLGMGALLGSHRALDGRRSWWRDGRLLVPWHPHTRAAEQLLTPGRVVRLDVEVYPSFARIARGHRLRLTLSSGMTNLAPTAVQAARLAGGVYDIEHGGRYRSALNVPLANPAALPTSAASYGGCNGGCRPPGG